MVWITAPVGRGYGWITALAGKVSAGLRLWQVFGWIMALAGQYGWITALAGRVSARFQVPANHHGA